MYLEIKFQMGNKLYDSIFFNVDATFIQVFSYKKVM